MIRFAAPASAFALLLSGTASFADVTADEAWADVRALMEGYGHSVTVGSEETSGNTLTVQDIVIDMSVAEANSTATLDQIAFVERGDGTVEIVLSPEYRVITRSTVEGETVEMELTMRHSALSIVVSGDADQKTYTYSAASLGADLTQLSAKDGPVPVTVNVDVAQPSGTYVSRVESGGRALESSFVANGAAVKVAGSDENSGKFDFAMDLSDLNGQSEAFLPENGDMEDLSAFLRDGFSAKGGVTYGANSYSFSGDAEGTQSSGSGQDEGGSLDFAMSAEGLGYGVESHNASFTMKSTEIPLPEVALAYEEGAFRLSIPVLQSETPQDFELETALRGLTMSDGIWALFDPMASLPRDPATVAVDLTGAARWFRDLFDPANAQSDTPPGEISALKVADLEVSLIGADLTGEGEFTFDNSDMTTFPGMPRPQGTANLTLVGGNALLDKLVAMGFVPQDQAMGFRMMLGLFARPGDGADTLVSNIEIAADGQVMANGQRIR